MKNKKTFIIASIIMIVMLCAAFTVKTFQNDTFYTVKIGESILEKGIDMKTSSIETLDKLWEFVKMLEK